jgi:aspartyl-tRNA(Asn)/glutamyl-tRNA(Gln) amidotransferase subunit B
MPDADIPPIILSREEILGIQSAVPMLPPEYRKKWLVLELDRSVIDSLLSTREYAVAVTHIQEKAGNGIAKRVAHWFASARGADDSVEVVAEVQPLSPDNFIELAEMVEKNELSSTAAKEIFIELLTGTESPHAIAERKNLLQVSDEGFVAGVVDEVLADPASARSIADIKEGKDKAIGYLVGQVMKKSQGKANPAMAQAMIKKKLN